MITFLSAGFRKLAAVFILFGLFSYADSAGAQTVVDPNILQFSASVDHNAKLPDGRPTVDHYEVRFFHQGASTPFQTFNLGKPTPSSSGVIQVNLAATVPTWPISSSTVNEARVAAMGPGGTGQSSPSNPFTFSQGTACTFALSQSAVSLGAGSGTGSLNVTTQTGCGWSAVSNAPWITVTLGSSMTGTGFVNFSLTANTSSSARTGTLTVAGQTITVTQAGTSCSYTLSTSAVSLGSASGSGSVSITTTAGCSWTAVSNATWLTITAGASGSGAGTVAFSATANQSWSPRTATLTIGGKTVTVTQAATSCSCTLSTTTVSMASASGTSAVGVTSGTNCPWTAVSNVTWITVTGGGSGSGNGTVTFSVKENASTSPRTGTLTIGGQTVSVNQAAAACSYTLSTPSISLPSTHGTGSVGVTASSGCAWTAVSNTSWITVTGGNSGSGSGTIGFSVTANSTTSSRSGTLTIAGKTVTVTQAGTTCAYTLSDTSVSLASTSGTGSVGVTSTTACSWTAASNTGWITVTNGSSHSGSGTVAFSVTANGTTTTRIGTLTIAGKLVTVTQAAGTCTYALSSTGQSFGANGGNGSVDVTASGTQCQWDATSTVGWTTVTSGATGTGSGTVNYTVAPNSGSTALSGTMVIAGLTYSVSVAAAAPTSTTIRVRTEAELLAAVQSLTSGTTIVVAPGSYALTRTLIIAGGLANVKLKGETNNPNDVVLVGPGMNNSNHGNVPEGILTGHVDGLTIANLTIRELYNHAVRFGPRTHAPRLSNVRFVNVGQEFVKSDFNQSGAVDDGVVEDSVFERLTSSRDANTTAIRVNGGARWQIRRNVFRNLVAPSGQMGSPAVLMTSGAADTTAEQNTFLNCQRGIAYGWTNRSGYDHAGGVIRNNFFYRSPSQPGDASIMVFDSPRSEVLHNTILTSGTHATPIEYRFADTVGVLIANNLLDGTIWARDGAVGDDNVNVGSAVPSMFVNAPAGDLHLVPGCAVVDRALPLADVVDDWDGSPRPVGGAADVGADELAASNRPPTVALTNPVTGDTFAAQTTVSLSAVAADSDGTIAKVQFYANSVLIGTVTTAPYTFVWKATQTTQSGSTVLTAVAVDNAGATATSSPVKITIGRRIKGKN